MDINNSILKAIFSYEDLDDSQDEKVTRIVSHVLRLERDEVPDSITLYRMLERVEENQP